MGGGEWGEADRQAPAVAKMEPVKRSVHPTPDHLKIAMQPHLHCVEAESNLLERR